MAFDTCGAAFTRLNGFRVVLQILNILLVFLANAAALHSMFGRHIKGRNALQPKSNMKLQLLLHKHLTVSLLLQDPIQSNFLNIWADDLSCALFGMANSVTAMYYLIDATTGKNALVEGGEISRPPWLGFSVHVFNTITAWADICCAHPRSFSKRSSRLSVGIVAFYTVWILVCSHFNGAFPYPILNELPWPAVSAKHLDFCNTAARLIHSVPCPGSFDIRMTAGLSLAGVHWNGIFKHNCVLLDVSCWAAALQKAVVKTY